MNDSTVFVTGATGFLGRFLLPVLSARYARVRVLVRHPDAPSNGWLTRFPNLDIITGDLHNVSALGAGMAGASVVAHAAGLFRFWGDATGFERVNVQGTQAMLDAARSAGIRRFVHVSTFAVVGTPLPGAIVDEAHPVQPQDPYQRSKLEAERRVLGAGADSDMEVVVLRPGAFYGPHGTYAFNRLFFQDPMRGLIMQMDGGKYIIPPVFVPDVAQAVALALERGHDGQIYNICGQPLSHRAAYDIVCREAKLRFPRLNLPGWMGIMASQVMERVASITHREPFYPLNMRTYVYNDWRVSSEKAERELGIRFTPFEDGARQTIAWYRAGRPQVS